MKSFWPRFRLAVIVSLVYAVLGIAYSFIGLLHPQPPVSIAGAITLEEIAGHMLFGFVVGLVSLDIVIALETTALSVAIDGGHILPQFGVHVVSNINHSLTFMFVSAAILVYIFRKQGAIKLAAITAGAFLAHISFDIIDGGSSAVPLLSPFNFSQIPLPTWAVIPIEAMGMAIVSFAFRKEILAFINSKRMV